MQQNKIISASRAVCTVAVVGLVTFPQLWENAALAQAATTSVTPGTTMNNRTAMGQQPPQKASLNWNEAVSNHPAEAALRRLFPAVPAPVAATPRDWKSTGLKRADYLKLIAGNVDFWKRHLDARGAIIDPYEKKERQYSTPAFALSAAALVVKAGRRDLLEPATRAFTRSLTDLSIRKTADNHADFYIPMLMHAHRLLAPLSTPVQRASWKELFASIVPEKNYRDRTGSGNWNIVNVAGEAMRRRDGLVAPDQLEAQMAYIERCLQNQQRVLTPFGMYFDANAPLAYDAFPRLWLDDMMADGAYNGAHHARLLDFLTRGGLSTLLLLSPSGEWANGGRSAQHQWNEAEVAVISEVNARRWMAQNRPDIAGAFKRAAHLAYTSMLRWQRPSGELWIVKNFADPARRHGFEGYSFHSQYNLLAVAMLAIAHERADDSIAERPMPSEIGGYVFDVREQFHKVVACAGGTYVLIETGADITYDATGLLRVHRAGVALSPYSGNAAPGRRYGPTGDPTNLLLTPGLAWKNADTDAVWRSLGDARLRVVPKPAPAPAAAAPPVEAPAPSPLSQVLNAGLTVRQETPQRVEFSVRYELQGEGLRPVEEDYIVTADGTVEVATRIGGDTPPAQSRLLFPALMSDGARELDLLLDGARAVISRPGGALEWEVLSPTGLNVRLDGPRIPSRNGWMQGVMAPLPPGTREARWRLRLSPGATAPQTTVPTALRRSARTNAKQKGAS